MGDTHTIYVRGTPSENRLLRDILAMRGGLAAKGVTVRGRRVSRADVSEMKTLGIKRLPSLVTPRGVYVGAEKIQALYRANLPAAGPGPGPGPGPADPLGDFYRANMGTAPPPRYAARVPTPGPPIIGGGGWDDDDDSEDLTAKYQAALAARAGRPELRPAKKRGGKTTGPASSGRRPLDRPGAGANVPIVEPSLAASAAAGGGGDADLLARMFGNLSTTIES